MNVIYLHLISSYFEWQQQSQKNKTKIRFKCQKANMRKRERLTQIFTTQYIIFLAYILFIFPWSRTFHPYTLLNSYFRPMKSATPYIICGREIRSNILNIRKTKITVTFILLVLYWKINELTWNCRSTTNHNLAHTLRIKGSHWLINCHHTIFNYSNNDICKILIP